MLYLSRSEGISSQIKECLSVGDELVFQLECANQLKSRLDNCTFIQKLKRLFV